MSRNALVLVEELAPGVLLLTLNRPDSLNPLDVDTVAELHRALDDLESRPGFRVCVLTGAPPAFSAGGDLKKYLDLYESRDDFAAFLRELGRLLRRLESGSFASIAMVNGICAAGGLELALSCDLIIAAESARLGDLHINYAQLPGAGGSQRLVRAVGTVRAKSLLLTGSLHSASEALAMGLVSAVVPTEELKAVVTEQAKQLAKTSGAAVEHMKQLVNIAVNSALEDGLEAEQALVLDYATTNGDARDGLVAFLERRNRRVARGT